MIIIYFLISLGASIVGSISGIGGGVIIKPVFDGLGIYDVTTISFLSGCTVLSMTIMTLYKSRNSKIKIDKSKGTLLALGGVAGGGLGKGIFDVVKSSFEKDVVVGAVQSIILIIMTVGVFLFTIYKDKIKYYKIENRIGCIIIGLLLGSLSAFLGIGGGPINLAVLYLFFAMDSKTAALNSIYIIFFSQVSSLLFTITSGKVPNYDWKVLLCMITGGVSGGHIGSIISKKLSSKGVDKLFRGVLLAIIMISTYNLYQCLNSY